MSEPWTGSATFSKFFQIFPNLPHIAKGDGNGKGAAGKIILAL